ncbi:MAG TPA: cellulase family glycosylhydrolase, partial [Candidatus Limiplasma sp.]|nr:cellulase family glycosylhydrolase [Candidatus Limiplasma sp.]
MADIHIEQSAIPDSEALRFTRALKAGWNLGNTFDAVDANWIADKLQYETAWAGVKTTPQLFETLKSAGFASVRIPVSWHNHVDADFVIDADWLARVREVIGYALDAGLFVIVNTHHDIDPAFVYPDEAHLESSKAYLTAIWSQLAEAFRDTDERLI